MALAIVGIPAVSCIVATTYFALGSSAENYAHRMEFDEIAWRNRSFDADPRWPTRLRMVDDLMEERRLDGLTRREIESLLGPGDQTAKWQDWHLIYQLGPERGLFRIDSEWLVIRFGPSGLVEYRVVRD